MQSLKRLFHSFKYACKGIGKLVQQEANARIHLLATIVVVLAGWGLALGLKEWALLMLAMGMVWSAEGFNTAIEALADHIQPEHHPRIAYVKDMASGGVLLAAIFAALTGAFVFIPEIVRLF